MKFVVWVACVLAFAQLTVARDGTVRPASNSHKPNSVHSASGDDTCGDGIVSGDDDWHQIAKAVASDAASNDAFGYSVSISGDTAVVGAYADDAPTYDSGSVYVFERNVGGADAWGQVVKLTASDGATSTSDFFGASVSVSGDTVVVGATGDDDAGSRSGSVYVFERNVGGADAWGQVAKLTASDAADGDEFGFSVSVSGDTIVVGALFDYDGGSASGSAYVFERNAGAPGAWGQVAKLIPSDAAGDDRFGYSVSVSGDTVVVGALFGGDAGSRSGSAYVFERNVGGADAWGQVAKLTASDAATNDAFGRSVSVGGDTVVVGAYGDDDAGSSSGSAYVFERNAGGSVWGQAAKLTASDAAAGDNFGYSVAVSGETVMVGATGDNDAEPDSGSAYVFERNVGGADDWGQSEKLTASDAAASDRFGWSVSVSGDTVVVGAPLDDDAGSDSGSAYILRRGEECDDGTANSDTLPDACRTDCTLPGCGDDVTDSGEACDDGASNSDIAADACRTDCTLPACGDGVTDTGEECDDGNTDDGDGCNATCQNECGDGIQEAPEECDNGTANSDSLPDACRTDCTLPSCGDDVTDSGEACDDGVGNSDTAPDACRTDCTFPACGDGATDTGEECDDGNNDDGDGCNATCRNECGDGIVNGACGWNQIAKLTAFDAAAGDFFGAVSVSGDTIVVGAPGDDGAESDSGSAYVFVRNVGGADPWVEVAKLTAFDAAAGDYFGRSVSLSDDTVVVGAYRNDDAGSSSGSAYVFVRNVGGTDAWGQVATLTAPDAAADDRFGFSVSVSGDTVVVGAYGDDGAGAWSGSAYVFGRNVGGTDAWGQVAKLTASDAAAEGAFGRSVSVSGDTVVVGAYSDPDAGWYSGSAYVFERNVGGADAWGQVAKLTASDAALADQFGWSVSVSGDTVVVGADLDNGAEKDSGSAYVFVRNAGGADAWGQVEKLTASDAATDDRFGDSVSISGDTIVVGAYADDDAGSRSGSAYVFERNVGGADAWGQAAKLTASDARSEAFFGGSVSVGGDMVVAGASGDDDAGNRSGSAYILTLECEECDDGTANSDTLPDACRTNCTLPSCGDDVIDSGETCDDGASNSDTAPDACRTDCTLPACGDGATDTGEECDDGNNDDGDGCNATCQSECGNDIEEWNPFAKLTASDARPDDRFGTSVSASGDTVVVGASNDDDAAVNSGSAYVFEPNAGGNAWGQAAKLFAADAAAGDRFGASVGVSGDTIVVGAPGDDDAGGGSGSAYVFERNVGGTNAWGQVAKLTAFDAAADDFFGGSVSVVGDTVVVGAPFDDDAGSRSGSVYVFERNVGGSGAWGQVAKLTASDAAANDYFGGSVSVSGNTVVVGARLGDDAGWDSGSAYVFERNAGGADAWGQVAQLTALDVGPNDRFGVSVSVNGDTVVVGAYFDRSAYVFERNVGGANAWGQFAKLTPSGVTGNAAFGISVSVSGDTVVVGANEDDGAGSNSGSAFVFERNVGGANAWGQVARLTAFDAAAGDDFGRSVSVSGDTVVVGAYRNDDAGSSSGSAYIWELGCVSCGDDIQEALEECDNGTANSDTIPDACRTDCTLPGCGDDVIDTGEACDDGASNSDTAPDACRTDCTFPACGDGVADSGEACDDGASNSDTAPDACRTDCTFPACGDGAIDTGEECDDGNTDDGDGCDATCQNECGHDIEEWNPFAKPVASDTAAGDFFGNSVSVSGDTIVVGAHSDDDAGSGSGSAYVFERNAGGADAWGQVAKLTASDAAAGDFFGHSVSVSGDTIVVGAHSDDDAGSGSGSAYVFERNAGGADAWGQVAKLTASDAAAGDYFGSFVSISGDTIVVGAHSDDDAGSGSGSAYVFERNAGGADAWGQAAKLTASDAAGGDNFGSSVAASAETVVVGAPGDDDAGFSSGSAYVFERNVGGVDAWGQAAKLTAFDAGLQDRFGTSISVSGDTVVVGAYADDAPIYNSGSVYVFVRNVGGVDAWGHAAKLTASDAAGDDRFGGSVSVSGDRVVVGASSNNDAGPNSGSAYVFVRNVGGADAWGEIAKLTAFDAAASDYFGTSVSLSDDTAVVGAYRNDDAGSAYIWESRCVACGDDVQEALEECDDGTDNSDTLPDACRTDCTLPSCGDDVTDSGEACDDGASNSDTAPDACRTDCTSPACGDGVTDIGEECDDGNNDDGDGCNATCQIQFCGDGIQVAPEECDDGTANSDTLPDACRTDCTLPSCGDHVTDSGEACDDGASNSDTVPDACRTDCTFPVCGDGVTDTDSGEECDDGNNDDGDGCDATCQNEFCGDGIVNNSGCESFQMAKPVASDAAFDDFFGVSVSISGDTAVVGAPGDDDAGSSSGSVYVLERNMGGADAWGQVAKLTASDAAPDDYFGTSVSVSGDTVVVGARRDDAGPPGSAYVFERNAGGADAWGQVATLTASDNVANDQFGISVSVSGDTVVVGAYFDDDAGFYSGSAYVFERNVGGADAWGQAAKLTASDGSDYDWFGYSVSVSGDTVVVGARNNESAYVFERNMGGADVWGQAATLIASDAHDGEFVASVSVSGDTIVVGGGNNNPLDGPDPGFAYVFERNVDGAGAWGEVVKLTASDATADDLFGYSVSVSGDTVVVGATFDDDAGSSSGSAYVFERNVGGADAWGEVVKLTASDADAYDYFGTSVSVGGDTIAVGAPGDDDAGSTSGSAYILTYGCEECDDGNTAAGDGCSSICQTEMGPNLIESSGFEQRGPWRFFTNGMGMFQVAGGEAVLTIENSGSNTQLFQRFGGLVAGTYKIDFDVKSSPLIRARTILLNETNLSWIAQAGFRARPAWSHVTSTLVVPADVPSGRATARLSFYVPDVPIGTTLHFDNVVLKRVGPN